MFHPETDEFRAAVDVVSGSQEAVISLSWTMGITDTPSRPLRSVPTSLTIKEVKERSPRSVEASTSQVGVNNVNIQSMSFDVANLKF